MTVHDCIQYIDSIEPNAYSPAQKTRWISECEGKVYTGLFLMQPYEFVPVVYDAEKDRTLAIPAPYDSLYPQYLQAMIHYANGEYDRYAASMSLFNQSWAMLARWFGGDYDVTDRRRNRRVTLPLTGEYGTVNRLAVPEGCALAGGRVVVRTAYTRQRTTFDLAEKLDEGSYNLRAGGSWYYFTSDRDLPAGTHVSYDEDTPAQVRAVIPGTPPTALSYVTITGKSESADELPVPDSTAVRFGGVTAAGLDLDARGSTPVPMLLAERGGAELEIVTEGADWSADGDAVFTARLLIPDEEFPFN